MYSEIQDKFIFWKENPDCFCQEVYYQPNYDWQNDAAKELIKHRKLAIRSGHGVGKSSFLARIAVWFISTRAPSKCIVTAPSKHQLYDILWPEFHKLKRNMLPALAEQITIYDEKICLAGAENECFIVSRTVRRESPEALQGLHEENILIIVDEASGVPDGIFTVGEGSLSTYNCYAILASNPTKRTGFFADLFLKPKAGKGWGLFQIKCHNSPGVAPEYISYMLHKYGEDSNTYRIRVLGEFPLSDEDIYIPAYLVDKAVNLEVDEQPYYPIWGLDVARYGSNATVLCKRKRRKVLDGIYKWYGLNTQQVAHKIIDEYNKEIDIPSAICIDAVGVGAGVYDRLSYTDLPVVAINTGSASSYPDINLNLKMDLWMKAREWFESQIVSIPDDEEFIAQLTSVPYKYAVNSNKMRILTKEELRGMNVMSPDIADAFVLTFAEDDVYNSLYDVAQAKNKEEYPYKRYIQKSSNVSKSWMAN